MQMRAEDIMGTDNFWNVRERERKEVDQLQRRCLEIQAQVDVATRTETIRHAPGFEDVLKALKAMHVLAREKLVGDDSLTDIGLRECRGRVRGLESVLALLTKPTVTEALAKELQDCKTQLAETLRRRPKQPEPTEIKP